jgi:hypothetical protein
VAVALLLLLTLAGGGVAAVAVFFPALLEDGLARLRPPASAPAEPARQQQLAWPADDLARGKILAPDLSKIKPLTVYDFSDPKGPWGLRPSAGALSHGYANGGYFMKCPQGGSYFEGRGDRHANFAAEVVGRFKGPTPTVWGLSLAGGTDEHPVLLTVRMGRKVLHVFEPRTEADAEEPPPDRMANQITLKPLDDHNRLLVILRGRQLEVYLNGVAPCDPVLAPAGLSPALVRLSVRFFQRGGEVEFERLTIWPADGLPTPEARGAVPK